MLEKTTTPHSVGTEKEKEDDGRAIETVEREEQRELFPMNAGIGMVRKGKEVVEILEHVQVYEEIDICETSHSRLKTTVQPVMMDAVVQEEPILSLENVINIPVDLSASRGVLQEMNVCDSGNIRRDTQNREKGGKGTWKPMRGKENADQNTKGSKKINNKPEGQKRQWLLRAEEDEFCTSQDHSKRFKGSDAYDANNQVKVRVASLEWSQIDQWKFSHGIVEV